MSFQPPDSFLVLQRRYEMRLAAGAPVYDQGANTGHFYVVLEGRIVFEVVDAAGVRTVVHEAKPGDALGVVSAFSDRPTSAAASAAEASVLLAIPLEEVADAFRASPELAIELIEQLANDGRRRQRTAKPADDLLGGEATLPVPAPVDVDVPLRGEYDERQFFVDDITCPVSGTTFQHLRVRAGAVHPTGRSSDFHIQYRDVDPTYYSVVVCPECSYAAYLDDFRELTSTERRDLIANQPMRDEFGRPYLCGTRTLDDARVATRLALVCYKARGGGYRREAGLLHRMAWFERVAKDTDAEARLLRRARDAYRFAFEREKDMTDATAMRAAYLIGDLSLRIGEPKDAARWLLTCVQTPGAERQAGLVRMARDRLSEAREAASLAAA